MPDPLGPRQGDQVPVLIVTEHGPCFVWHTPEEFARLWHGVDGDAAEAMEEEL